MLQQTQVVTVIPYYHRFITQFPNVADLAVAPLGDVLKAWEGLGYYSRARHLHRAAQEIVEQYDGELPRHYSELRKLPGFGEYTAGAVASIAFGETVPAVDGNVKRVLARLFAIDSEINRRPANQQIRQVARQLIDQLPAGQSAGDWNQALIELGALVCLPSKPNCSVCPLSQQCHAYAKNIQQELPRKAKKKPLPHYHVGAAVIRHQDKYLIAQRPLEGMLGGLWEFPGGKQEAGETLPQCIRREIQEELGVRVKVGDLVTTVKHRYTHFKITLHAYAAQLLTDESPQALGVADWRWVTMAEMARFAFPRTDLKIIATLQNNEQN